MENFITLPEEALVDILCRLPDADLVRSKCVCKALYHLISQVCVPRISLNRPTICISFATENHDGPRHGKSIFDARIKGVDYGWLEQKNNNDSLGRFIHSPCSASLPSSHSEHCFLDSCNGLLLFVNPVSYQYYVSNPTTKQVVMIPQVCRRQTFSFHALAFNYVAPPQTFCYAALAFHPSKSCNYKVVRVVPYANAPMSLDIYFSETGKWVHHILELDSICGTKWVRQSAYLQGKLYRLSYSSHLLCFHLDVVNVRAIKLPEAPLTSCYIGRIGCIGVSMGKLYYARRNRTTLFVWLLHDRCDTSEWLLKYNICISDIGEQVCRPIEKSCFFLDRCWLEPATFCSSSDVIFIYNSGIILSYNFKSKTLKEVFRSRDHTYIWRCHPIFAHVHCLVSLTYAGKSGYESTCLESVPFACSSSFANSV